LITEVAIPFEGKEMRGVLALPNGDGAEGGGPHPGVVVLHEMFGLNDDIRAITGRLASEGYAAVAPNLFSPGFKPLCIARTLVDMTRSRPGPVDQADAARTWLADRPEVDGARVGAIGFCMGGGFALALGIRADVRAVSVNYGQVPRRLDEIRGVCPVVGSYGREDKRFLDEADRLERFLTELGVDHDVKIYDGAGHSFLNGAGHPVLRVAMRPIMPFGYQHEAAEDAWHRILAFFERHLRAA
jgi:carboxymethylenebutenolidase